MLIAYWDKTIGKIYQFAIQKKDKKIIKILDKIVKIPKKI